MRRPREVSASCDRGGRRLFPRVRAFAAFAFSASSANDASSGSSNRTGPRPAPGAPRPRGAARGGDGDRSRDSASLPSKSVLSTTRCVSLFPGRTDIFAALRPASAAFASARCLDVYRARRAWRRGDGGETRGGQTRRRREKTQKCFLSRVVCHQAREIQKSDAREPRCSRRARPGDVRGWPARRSATSVDARATYLDLLFRELEFPHVPAGEVPPGALVVELRRLSRPRADDIFGARVRGKGRGAGPPGADDAALHTHLASSARRRARREPRVPRRASRVARIGEHKRFRSLLGRGFPEVSMPDKFACKRSCAFSVS